MSSAESRQINRLLVANRGEIARRVFRTAHEMGIDTVAVYADGDAAAPFVREAGQAVALGGRSAAETYLDVDKVLAAAAATGADAVHPGYGFLAENADFARAVEAAGLVWVGPPPDAIASMGDKLAAKAIMVDTIVPTLPSVTLDEMEDLAAASASMGYPVLVKASAGGGGKGMRVVESADELAEAVAGAQREAESSFGDPTVFIEKYLTAPRHVEIQVLGDRHGNLVHLFERECSIQRRHQKVIEEAPSPVLTEALRAEMGAAAVAAAAAVGYHSAGTVEFLVDGEGDDASFFFLEMNTRIQVEHPVTEEITGIDLVREQLRVAMGEPLGYGQDDLGIDGHSIEARLYAEDPAAGFLPATGTLWGFAAAEAPTARIDTGVEAGSVIGVEFDPMIAKVIVHAPTRTEAARRLALVLERMTVAGVVTNRDFLVATLRNEAFLAGDTTTDFIERVQPWTAGEPDADVVAAAARAAVLFRRSVHADMAGPLSFLARGWRNSSMPPERVTFLMGEREVVADYRTLRDGAVEVRVDDGPLVRCEVVAVEHDPWAITLVADGVRARSTISGGGATWVVQGVGPAVELVEQSRFPDHGNEQVAGAQVAPMPGKVTAVQVAAGDTVTRGQALVVVEAMKMEHTIAAAADGIVAELRCAVGDQVDNGQVLVVIDDGSGDGDDGDAGEGAET